MKYLINIDVTEEIEAEDAECAISLFLQGIEGEPQQTFATWLYDQITVTKKRRKAPIEKRTKKNISVEKKTH